jgi:rRNA maturation protein Nop10
MEAVMKKCPHCAEEIQAKCTKCPHCGEWLEEGHPKEFIPLKEESRWGWGWGWVVLALLIVPAFQKTSWYVTPITILITTFGIVLVLVFYFWARNKLIKKRGYDKGPWASSFVAGFFAYILYLGVIFGVGFIARYQERVEIRAEMESYSLELRSKFEQLNKEEILLSQKFISPPESVEDLEHNIHVLNKNLTLLKKRYVYSRIVMNKMKDFAARKNNKKIKGLADNLENAYERHYSLSREAIETLIKYYETGDGKLWDVHEALLRKTEATEREIHDTAKALKDFKGKLNVQ